MTGGEERWPKETKKGKEVSSGFLRFFRFFRPEAMERLAPLLRVRPAGMLEGPNVRWRVQMWRGAGKTAPGTPRPAPWDDCPVRWSGCAIPWNGRPAPCNGRAVPCEGCPAPCSHALGHKWGPPRTAQAARGALEPCHGAVESSPGTGRRLQRIARSPQGADESLPRMRRRRLDRSPFRAGAPQSAVEPLSR